MIKLKKRHYIILTISLFLFFILFFASTIIKNYLVNNSYDLVGRKLNLEELHINYFKVQVTANNFILYEENKKDTFVYFKQLLVNYDPWKLINNEYAVSEIRLEKPYVFIQQFGSEYNFDDMIPPSDSSSVENDSIAEIKDDNVKFSIKNIDLIDGTFNYYDKQIDNLLSFDDLNLELPVIAWNSKSSNMGLQFAIGKSGIVSIDANVNQKNKIYNIELGTKDIQLKHFTNYLKDYMFISDLHGFLQSDLQITGSIEHVDSILINGSVAVDSLNIKDDKGNTIASIENMSTLLKKLDLKNSSYLIENVKINKPFIYAALNPDTINWEHFFSPLLTENSVIVDSVKISPDTLLANEVDELFYKVDSVLITDGTVLFEDNTLNRPFKYSFTGINIETTNIYEKNDSIPLKWLIKFNNEGKYSGNSSFSINNPLNFNYEGKISNLDLHSFSPYTEYYLSYPIISGIFNYDAFIQMNSNSLKNDNHLLIKEMEFGKRTKDSTATKLPLKLALYLIKDAQDNIEFEIPVTGNPTDPGFKLGPVIWNTFGKFIAKTATQPFNSLAKLVGTQPEELERVPFKYTTDSLDNNQKKTLSKIANILTKKEDLVFSFRQETVVDDEILKLAEKHVKTLYLQNNNLQNSKEWYNVKNSDSNLNIYLNSNHSDVSDTDIYKWFLNICSDKNLSSEFESLYLKRNALLLDYLINEKGCNKESVKILNADFNNMSLELNKPGFRVEVSVK